jgi:tetratricopeptide (TPR) repeat protein
MGFLSIRKNAKRRLPAARTSHPLQAGTAQQQQQQSPLLPSSSLSSSSLSSSQQHPPPRPSQGGCGGFGFAAAAAAAASAEMMAVPPSIGVDPSTDSGNSKHTSGTAGESSGGSIDSPPPLMRRRRMPAFLLPPAASSSPEDATTAPTGGSSYSILHHHHRSSMVRDNSKSGVRKVSPDRQLKRNHHDPNRNLSHRSVSGSSYDFAVVDPLSASSSSNRDSNGSCNIIINNNINNSILSESSIYRSLCLEVERNQDYGNDVGTATSDSSSDLLRPLEQGVDGDPRFVWFHGQVPLSLLEDRQVASLDQAQSWGKMFIPSMQRCVQESCWRHLRIQALSLPPSSSSPPPTETDPADDGASPPNDIGGLIMSNPDKANSIITDFIKAGEYQSAMSTGKILLLYLQQQQRHERNEASLDSALAICTLARQLALLCLAIGRPRDAMQYSHRAVESLPDVPDPSRSRALAAVNVLMDHGLVLFGSNRIGQALKTWREATHMAIGVNGYEHVSVVVLLNYIGVLHVETGNIKNGLRSLEEAFDLQRLMLSERRAHSDIDHGIYRLATIMGNLAVVSERTNQLGRAVSFLDESLALFESVLADTSEMEDTVRNNMDRIVAVHEHGIAQDCDTTTASESFHENRKGFRSSFHNMSCISRTSGVNSFRLEDEYLLDTSDDDQDSSDDDSTGSNRSMSLFGNSDGIPNRRAAAMMTTDQADNHDFLLLGTLCPQATTEQRVRETILAWFGKRIDDDPFMPIGSDEEDGGFVEKGIPLTIPVSGAETTSSRTKAKQSIPVDLDAEQVMNADQRLHEIHKQAMTHLDNNEVQDALELFQSALRSHRAKYGEIHHLVGSTLHNIGMVHFFAKQYKEALHVFDQAVRVREEALGSSHPDVQSTKMKIALIFMAQGDLNQAYTVFWDVRSKLGEILGYGHPQLAKINSNLGVIAYEYGDIPTALKFFEAAFDYLERLLTNLQVKECEESLKMVSLATAFTLCNMAFVQYKAGERETSLELYGDALSLMKTFLSYRDHRVRSAVQNADFLVGFGGGLKMPSFAQQSDDRGGRHRDWFKSKVICRVDLF